MSTLYESYNTGDDGNQAFAMTSPIYAWIAQTFTPSIDHLISIVWVKLLRVAGSVPGICTLELFETSGSVPSGVVKATATENCDLVTTTSPGQWVEFTFTSSYLLSTSTMYAIRLRSSTDSLTNPIFWRKDQSSASYAGGAPWRTSDGGATWVTIGANQDLMFEEYGEASGGGEGGSIFPTDASVRVTSIIHRYNRGIYNMVLGFGEVVSDFLIPASATLTEKAYEPDEVKAMQEEDKVEEQVIRIIPKIVRTAPESAPQLTPQPAPPSPYKPPFPPMGLGVGEITGMEESGLPAPIVQTTQRTKDIMKTTPARLIEERREATKRGVAPISSHSIEVSFNKSLEMEILTAKRNMMAIASNPLTTSKQRGIIMKRVVELQKQLRELYKTR